MSAPAPRQMGHLANEASAGEPLVSIVVPAYNGAQYLRESLDSILGQTYRCTEVIVMDDASTDAAPEILRAYVDADERVRVHRQRENRGIFGNINTGIALASGDLIAIHHADDVYEPEILSRQVEYLRRHPDVGAVFCIDVFIDNSGREFGRLTLPREIRESEVLRYPDVLNSVLRHQNVFIRGGTSLIRKEVYEDVGLFDDRYLLRADLDMWLRMARRYPIAVIDEHLVKYRYGHDNSSLRYERLRTEPELWFDVVDRILAEGDVALARPDALAAFEGHRAEDLLMVVVNRYIVGRRRDARAGLARVSPRRILGTKRIQRWRLLSLWAALHVLVRLPASRRGADLFYRRWHAKGPAA
jgi:GT2 family glycosyltransferase